MEITVTIDNEEYTAKYNGATALIYRDTFGSDILSDLTEAKKKVDKELLDALSEGNELLDYMVQDIIVKNVTPSLLEKLLWSSLKTGNNIKDYRSFLASVDNYNAMIGSAINVYELMVFGNKPTVEMEKDEESEEEDESKKKTKKKLLAE